jgi:hypothetical protein
MTHTCSTVNPKWHRSSEWCSGSWCRVPVTRFNSRSNPLLRWLYRFSQGATVCLHQHPLLRAPRAAGVRMWRALAHIYVTQMLRANFTYDVRHVSPAFIMQMLRAPAAHKGYYFWTPLYLLCIIAHEYHHVLVYDAQFNILEFKMIYSHDWFPLITWDLVMKILMTI